MNVAATKKKNDHECSERKVLIHSVHPPPPFCKGGGLSLQPNFQKGGLTGPQLLEGVAGKEGVTFFRGGLQLSHKK